MNEHNLREEIGQLEIEARNKQSMLDQTAKELSAYRDLLAAVRNFERVFDCEVSINLHDKREIEVIS